MSATYMRQCTGKNRHETQAGASGQRASLAAARNLPVSTWHVYSCEQCLGYHVGRNKRVLVTRRRRSGKRANKRMRGR
jgi:hypothetical protein